MHLKNKFFIKSSIFVLVPWESPEGPLEVPDVRTFRGPSGDVHGTSRAGWVLPVLGQWKNSSRKHFNIVIEVAKSLRVPWLQRLPSMFQVEVYWLILDSYICLLSILIKSYTRVSLKLIFHCYQTFLWWIFQRRSCKMP